MRRRGSALPMLYSVGLNLSRPILPEVERDSGPEENVQGMPGSDMINIQFFIALCISLFNNATLHIHHLEYRFSQYEDSLTATFRQPLHYLSICAKIFSPLRQKVNSFVFFTLEIPRQGLLRAAYAGNENGPHSGENCHQFVKPQMRKNETSWQCSSHTLFSWTHLRWPILPEVKGDSGRMRTCKECWDRT
ncbi:hypothetical protein CDAR_557051 [Caerostris darwini]|uniref:Uncharacterized protein n=1 Tax=Caerostris darwini TaxID=1538125 RepID=A0AAV4TZW3_9ARAC|nr:hypothetical protein CDAR_557051 [Caerostris darwini]